ncbi:MAG: SAM-dependent methyltransferase [Candidatus Aminicenantes bacterium]|nr:SAM-dependent methyltransferase [Candidatus Aminicenantes bacterium]
MRQSEFIINLKPIGTVQTTAVEIPRHWSASDIEGRLVIDKKYREGLKDIRPGQRIVVIFYFHQSPVFTLRYLCQTPPHRDKSMGVFSICSPVRPNALGLSVLDVLAVKDNIITVNGLDMRDGTPILDIKPHIE